ncbi:hypothetical protein ACSMX9_22720 [Streptomyces sp. LE64]|uniref:hypothetical protein n=1 Tax=Streptomyces sp. LE64 TaxID=3448653 RepID=UPI004041E9F1
MPWVRIDDRFPSHRKVALLSDRAFRLYVSALCWSAEGLTEGRISARELPLVARVRNPRSAAAELESAGLWDPADDGWAIHDYLEYNPSRARVKEERAGAAARAAAYRERQRAKKTERHGVRHGDDHAPRHGVTDDAPEGPIDTTATRREHDGDTTAHETDPKESQNPQVSDERHGVSHAAPSPTRPLITSYGSNANVDDASTGAQTTPDPEPQRDDVERVCAHLADRIEQNGSKRPTITKTWRTAARLLLDRDGRTEDQVHAAIDWCQDSDFWRANILSMVKLRKQYDTLRLQAVRDRRPAVGADVIPLDAARRTPVERTHDHLAAALAAIEAREAGR